MALISSDLPRENSADEGHHDLVGALDLGLQAAQAFLDACIEQFVVFHPLGQQLQAQGELAPPCAVLVKLLVEGSAHDYPADVSI
jgi:hypothetical protein